MNDEPFIKSLARPHPNPGGGGAAAYASSVALALLEKIVRLELQREDISPIRTSFWNGLLDRVNLLAETLTWLRDEDGRTYLRMSAVRSLDGKTENFEEALGQATESPIRIVEKIEEAQGSVLEAAEECKRHLLSDLLVVTELLHGASEGASHIARANLRMMKNPIRREKLLQKVEQAERRSRSSFKRAKEAITATMNPAH